MLLVGSGFFVYCIDVLRQTTSTYGGLTGALGWRFLRGHEPEAPPASVIAATVVAFDGLLAMSAGMAIGLGLLGRTYDSERRLRPARLEEPRLLLRAHDRQPAHLPRRRRRLRAAAPLRGPPLRGDEGLRRRLGRRARPDRHRLLAPPVHGLRPAALGRDRLRDQLVRLGASRSP